MPSTKTLVTPSQTIQDRNPNWRTDGKLYLLRCFACGPEHGKENWGPAVASGQCAWCGWTEEKNEESKKD